jgi:hypothetical protein
MGRKQGGDVNENLRRAMEALETGASEVRDLSAHSTGQLRDRLKRTVEEVLDHLEAEGSSEPEDIFSSLDRQSRDIAENLRRAERLMKRRTGQE